jgi:hypothetical protein
MVTILNNGRFDPELTPETAQEKGYEWLCDLPTIPTCKEMDKALQLVEEEGYMFGTSKYDDEDPTRFPNTALYKPLEK